MKRLYLIRHAKSSWEYDLADHLRPLNKRGVRDANLVAKHLKNRIELPKLVLSSDAVRAKSTADIFLKTLKISSKKFKLVSDLYDFGGKQVIEIIHSCDDNLKSLMIFGHNNAMTYIAKKYGDPLFGHVPTCGFVHVEFKVSSWKEIGKGKIIEHVFPRHLK